MSYSDYNTYQQSSDFNSSGGYDSSYGQSNQVTTQYTSSDQYTVSKGPQQYNSTQDYTESYTQFPDASAGNYYSSGNDYNFISYNQDTGTESLSSGYDASQGYQQTPQYQSAQPEALATTDNQVGSSNTGFDSSGLYNYSDSSNYNNTQTQQYDQGNYSYGSGQAEPNRFPNQSNQSFESQGNSLHSSSGFSPQNSRSNQYPVSSNAAGSGNFQSGNNNFAWGNTEPQNKFNEYQQRSSSGNYSNFQSNASGYQGSIPRDSSNFDGSGNSQTDMYSSSSHEINRNNFNHNKRDEPYGGFSYSPKKEYGSFSQSGRGGFTPQSKTDNYSFSGGNNFSSQGGDGFSSQGSNNFSSFGGRGKNNFGQRRDERGAAMSARNNNSQGRFGSPQSMNPVSGNTWSSGSWRGRGSSRGGPGQFANNRGRGNFRNDNFTAPSSRGGKFNNVNQGERANQFRPQSNHSGSFADRQGDRKPSGNGQFSAEVGKNRTEATPTKDPVGSKPSQHMAYQTNVAKKSNKYDKVELKAPVYPNQKLLNEVEAKKIEKPTKEDPKVCIDSSKKEERKEISLDKKKDDAKVEEEKSKPTDQSVKVLAPPSKAPETPEEIAREEEIQRKIRESIVVINPDYEKKLLSDDPIKEVEMSDELRELLKTVTTEHFCKLCSLRMIGPQMATMHYNGKNHLKKVRIFVQTNGRSAGFNMETLKDEDAADKLSSEEKSAQEEKEVDEKKYCKLCKVAFSQDSQSEMHYKGKNHAKKVRSITNGSGFFECKICCVTVTAQEHLTAHMNGARHKLQIRKMEGDNAHRGGLRGRGGYRGTRGGRGAGRGGQGQSGEGGSDVHNQGQAGSRGRGNSRGRGQNFRGNFDRGSKRPTDSFSFGGSFDKRPRYTNYC